MDDYKPDQHQDHVEQDDALTARRTALEGAVKDALRQGVMIGLHEHAKLAFEKFHEGGHEVTTKSLHRAYRYALRLLEIIRLLD